MTSLEIALSLANDPSGGGLRGNSPGIAASPISLLSMGGVCGRSLTAGKILFTGRQTCSLYLLQGNVVHVLSVSWQNWHSADSTHPQLFIYVPFSHVRSLPRLQEPLTFRCSVEAKQRLTWVPHTFPTPRGCLRPLISPGVLQVKIWVKIFTKWIPWTYTRQHKVAVCGS